MGGQLEAEVEYNVAACRSRAGDDCLVTSWTAKERTRGIDHNRFEASHKRERVMTANDSFERSKGGNLEE